MARATVGMGRLPHEDESEEALHKAVRDALEPFGGLAAHVKRGSRVLLKPNQTLFLPHTSGSTTSPRLIRVLTEQAFDLGAKEVWVAEAAGHAQRTRNVSGNTGLTSGVEGTGARMIYLDEIAHDVYDFGEDAGDLRYMPAPEIFTRADVIIDVPKAKTHFVDPVSGACKNWVGVVPMSYRLALQRKIEPYYRATGLFLRKFRPHLSIFDGAWAGEGQGPGANDAFWWGWIMAATDPVAADVMLARLFGLGGDIRMAKAAADVGVGVYDESQIELANADFADAHHRVKPADPSIHRFPCNVVADVGSPGATIEGTLGHWKTIADGWHKYGLWRLFGLRGRPTFMFGGCDDPDFEKHLEEGPYVVLDDAAKDQYKHHPKVTFVPGSPVPQSYMQNEMIQGMGFGGIYQLGLSVDKMIERFKGTASAKG